MIKKSDMKSRGFQQKIHIIRWVGYKCLLFFIIFSLIMPISQSLKLLDTQDDGGDYRHPWVHNNTIFAACSNDGLRAYSFDGSDLTLIDSIDNGSNYREVWGDGTYIYVACYNEGIRAYSWDGISFTLLDTQDDGGNYWGVGGNDSYVYAACGASGLRAYSFNGITFNLIDTIDNSTEDYYDVDCNDSYIFTAVDDHGVFAYSFDGTNLNYINKKDDGSFYRRTHLDKINGYIYVACYNEGVRAYSFNGAAFTLLDTQHDGADAYGAVVSDANYVYTSCNDEGLRKYTFDGSSFSLKCTVDDGSDYLGVYNDTNYVYVGCTGYGIRAYDINPKPEPPYNVQDRHDSVSGKQNITWTNGTRTTSTLVVNKTSGYPTSITDGTIVQNSTLSNYSFTPNVTMYFTLFSYDNVTKKYSDGVNVSWASIGINCFNESNPSQTIDFDIEISNQNGTNVYYNTSQSNTLYLGYSEIPFGLNTIFTIENSSYEPRQYFYDLVANTFYNYSFYLPPLIYETVDTELYTVRVIDSYEYPVAGADVKIKRYNNVTDVYETVTSKITNGYGECDAYLMPGVNYKFFVSKDGFESFVNDSFIDPVFYGKNYPIILQLEYSFDDTPDYDFWDVCTFNATKYSNNTIKVVFVDGLDGTNSVIFNTYEVYNDTENLNATNSTTSNSFTFWIKGINISRSHRIELQLTHSTLGSPNVSILVMPLRSSIRSISNVNTIIGNIMGDFNIVSGGLGYVEFFIIFIPFIVIIGVGAMKKHAGGGVIVGAFYGAFMTGFVFEHDIISVMPFIAALGIILIAVKGGKIDL